MGSGSSRVLLPDNDEVGQAAMGKHCFGRATGDHLGGADLGLHTGHAGHVVERLARVLRGLERLIARQFDVVGGHRCRNEAGHDRLERDGQPGRIGIATCREVQGRARRVLLAGEIDQREDVLDSHWIVPPLRDTEANPVRRAAHCWLQSMRIRAAGP